MSSRFVSGVVDQIGKFVFQYRFWLVYKFILEKGTSTWHSSVDGQTKKKKIHLNSIIQ